MNGLTFNTTVSLKKATILGDVSHTNKYLMKTSKLSQNAFKMYTHMDNKK